MPLGEFVPERLEDAGDAIGFLRRPGPEATAHKRQKILFQNVLVGLHPRPPVQRTQSGDEVIATGEDFAPQFDVGKTNGDIGAELDCLAQS